MFGSKDPNRSISSKIPPSPSSGRILDLQRGRGNIWVCSAQSDPSVHTVVQLSTIFGPNKLLPQFISCWGLKSNQRWWGSSNALIWNAFEKSQYKAVSRSETPKSLKNSFTPRLAQLSCPVRTILTFPLSFCFYFKSEMNLNTINCDL